MIKYQHIERLGTTATEGILDGTVYIFPKLDGANARIWREDGVLRCGSRTQELNGSDGLRGFKAHVMDSADKYNALLDRFAKGSILYGEWLVPHTIKTYEDDAWNKFYLFDIMTPDGRYYVIDHYEYIFLGLDIDFVPLITKLKSPEVKDVLCYAKNTFLCKEGTIGEGVVIKNYDYKNKYGNQIWAKVINAPSNPKSKQGGKILNRLPANEAFGAIVTEHLVMKEKAKIETVKGYWGSDLIPMLLGRVFYTIINEELYDFIKARKMPIIDFKQAKKTCDEKVKLFLNI